MVKKKLTSEPIETLYYDRYKIRLKKEIDIQHLRRAGRLVVDTLDLVESAIRPGMTTDEINAIVHDYTIQNNAIPAPLNYKGFPKSVCTSVNDVICHGIPGKRVLYDGDIINVDVTSILDGYFADANRTFFVGTPGDVAKKNCTCRGAEPQGSTGHGKTRQLYRGYRMGDTTIRGKPGLLRGERVCRAWCGL